jgi:hypothetical protein
VLDYRAVITKDKPEKSLTVGKRRANGRNHHGVITAKHRGGGNKKLYRIIDFKRQKDGMNATVQAIEYDPNRSVNIALLQYEDGEKTYILALTEFRLVRPSAAAPMHRPKSQRDSAGEHPGRDGNPQRGDESGPRRKADSLRRWRRGA